MNVIHLIQKLFDREPSRGHDWGTFYLGLYSADK